MFKSLVPLSVGVNPKFRSILKIKIVFLELIKLFV